MTQLETLLLNQQLIELELSRYETIINNARRGAMGLTLEDDKTPEWEEAKRMHAITWTQYQNVNKQLNKLRKFKGYQLVDGKRVAVYEYK